MNMVVIKQEFFTIVENQIRGEIGIMWNEDKISTPTKTGILVNPTGWIHLIFIFNKNGAM